jgi:hypothetical protein
MFTTVCILAPLLVCDQRARRVGILGGKMAKMIRLIRALLPVVFALSAAALTASGQTQITFSGSSAKSLEFSSTGTGTVSMTIPSTPGLGGPATGGYYWITGGGVTLSPSTSGVCTDLSNCYVASGSLSFDVTTGAKDTGSSLLTGTLTLVEITQGGLLGQTNSNMVADVTVTGGSEAPSYSGVGINLLTLNFSGVSLLTLSGDSSGTHEFANVITGSISPTPEPASMLLFGSGLLLFGAILRRQLRA